MIVTIQSAELKDNYILDITMTNENHLILNMAPYLDTVQFVPLKDKTIWKNVVVLETCLRWQGNSKVEVSINTLVGMVKEDKQFGQEESKIREAMADDRWMLNLWLENGNSITFNVRGLLEYSIFAPLSQKRLWKNMQVKEHSLLWEDKNIKIELPITTLFDYFT